MGSSSSQPVPDQSKSTIAPTTATQVPERAPRYSPKMDDLAASQQLIDEGAETNYNTNTVGDAMVVSGTTESTSASRKQRLKSGESKPRKSSTPQAAASPVAWKQPVLGPLRSYSLADLQAFTDSDEANESPSGWPVSPLESQMPNVSAPPNDDIEVPDSQPTPTTPHALMSPPMTSSLITSANVPQKSDMQKKRNKRKQVNSMNSLPDGEDVHRGEDTAVGVSEVSAPSTSQPKRKRRHSSNVSPIPSSQVEPSNGETQQKQRNKRRKANGIEIYGWPASSRKPGQRADELSGFGHEEEAQDDIDTAQTELETLSQKRRKPIKRPIRTDAPAASISGRKLYEQLGISAGENEIPTKPLRETPVITSGEHKTSTVTPSERKRSSKKQHNAKTHKPTRLSQTPRRIRTSNVGHTNVLTAAERALNTVRDLNHPPNLQKSGDFTHDEEELIRRAIRDYQERKGMDTFELVEVIQWTDDTKDVSKSRQRSDRVTREVQEEEESNEFWEEIKHINLSRRMETVRNHIRSHYHTYKSGGWTKEEDEELKNLFELYPRQWKLISQAMGDRSMHDVHNRWRDYVQHGDKRNTSTWSQDEECLLLRAVTTVLQRDEDHRAEVGRAPLNEYTNKDINWAQVCTLMGNIRSRLQCTVKWTKMQSRHPPPRIPLEIKPRTRLFSAEEAEQVFESTPKKRGRPQKSNAQQTPQTLTKRGRPRKGEEISVLDLLKKHRKSKKSNVTATEPEIARNHRSETQVSIPAPERSAAVGTPCVSQMRWGDKFDLMEAILNREKESAENIDWHDVAAAMQHSWSVRALQTTQQLLFEVVTEKGLVDAQASFEDIADAVLGFLAEEHGEELKEHYDPFADAELVEDLGEPVSANLPTPKRKRKTGAHDSMPRSQPTSVKDRKTLIGLQPTTPRHFKSTELISDSDDAENEPGS